MNYDNLTKDELIGELKFRYEELYKQDKEIERLTPESTEWESKFYDEVKKNDKAIEYIKEDYEINKYSKDYLLNILQGDNSNE